MTTPRSAKQKGRMFEDAVAERVREWTGLDDDHIKRSRAAYSGEDLEMSRLAQSVLPFDFECKNQKTLSIPAWIRQVEKRTAKSGKDFVVVFKNHGSSRMFAVIDFDVFLELATRYRNEVPND